jgi:hypothetical protein
MKNLALCLSLVFPFSSALPFSSAFLLSPAASLAAQASNAAPNPPCPMSSQPAGHDAHHATVRLHGDQAMGFSHDKTTHHFHLLATGGVIQVTANDKADKASIEAIRSHLTHIAAMFADGDFSTPMFVHDSVPPGVTTMKILKDRIRFAYESIDSGARVRIVSADPVALAAIHDFLRFQITDHQTGDALM